MPVTDVRVTLRVTSSDHLRPRAWQGSGIAIVATILDQDDAPVVGAVADLAWRTPDGVEIHLPGLVSDSAGVVTGLVALTEVGDFTARCSVISPQAEVVERAFALVASAFDPEAEAAVVLVDDAGEYILLDDGTVMEG